MSGCSGLHCAGCGGGAGAPVVALLGICGADWVFDHIVEVAVVSGACGTVALAAVVVLMRWAERRDAARMTVWRAERWPGLPGQSAAHLPRAERPAVAPVHIHFHGLPAAKQATVIRQAIGGRTDQP